MRSLVSWRRPKFEEEAGEFFRTHEELSIAQQDLLEGFENAELEDLRDEDWEQMLNCDSRDTTWTLEEIPARLKEHGRDFDTLIKGFEAGDTFPAPIVLFREGKRPYLVAGNSRLLICRGLKTVRPKILAIRL